MSTTISYSRNTFAYIYKRALKIQLQKIGESLKTARTARKEDLQAAANAVKLSKKELERIEKGYSDFRLQELMDLCKHYGTNFESMVKDSGLMQFKFV